MIDIQRQEKRTNKDSEDDWCHQNCISRIMRWKLMPKMPCNKYAKDNNWSNYQQEGENHWPGIWPKYQSPTKEEFLQDKNNKLSQY